MGIEHEHDRFSCHLFLDALGSLGACRAALRAKKDSELGTAASGNRDELMQELQRQGIGSSKVHARNDTHSVFTTFRRPWVRSSD
jgi:hypothetical protein